MAACKLEHLAPHVGGEGFFAAVEAGAQAGATTAGQGRDHDGAGVDSGSSGAGVGANDEVGALDADGGHGGVKAKTLARRFAPATGNRAHDAFIEAEFDGTELGLAGGVAVAFYLQSAGGPQAEATSIHKAQQNVATSLGFDAVADADGGSALNGTAGACFVDSGG